MQSCIPLGKNIIGDYTTPFEKKTGTGMRLFALRKFVLPMNETTV